MTKFGKTILLVVFVILIGGAYILLSQSKEKVSVDDFVSESDSDFVYSEETDKYTIEAVYPKFGPATADAQVFVLKEIAEFKSIVEETPSEFISFPYSLSIAYEEKAGAGLTSYIYTVYTYTGGAHGNTYLKTFAYDSEGTRILFEDILKKGQQNIQAVARFAERSLKESLEEGDSLFEEGVSAEYENFENFYVGNDQLVFLFQPYQVAAYVLGILEAKVPLESVFGYFKKNTFNGYDEVREFRGNIVSGSEARDFMYCAGENVLWYQDTTGSLSDEYDHAKRSEDPYEKVPVIVEGYTRSVATSVDGEFASLRDGLLVITDLYQVGGGGVCE
jgi:hypothetical protein